MGAWDCVCCLAMYRYKLISMRSSEKNRFQNAFTVCNVALDSVVSDMFGKSAAAITDYLTSDEDFDPQHCVSLLQRSLKKKADDVLESIRFLYKGIIIKHNKTEPTYTKTSLFLCEKRRFFMGRTEKGGKVF